ncbi:MAG: N-acetyl-gamma-glutamyl-phosphate reductase [Nitrospirota bacterium]
MLRTAIIGASGYAGGELIRLLHNHPDAEIALITSEQSEGKTLEAVHPHLKSLDNRLVFERLDPDRIGERADFIFLCLPHTTSIEPVSQFINMKKKVVDLSADYRLKDPDIYEEWYEKRHTHKELMEMAVYGLSEIKRDKIKKASLIASPGCYPTGVLLAAAPLIMNDLLAEDNIIIDSKSAISGAGRGNNLPSSFNFSEINEGIRAYKIGIHRHIPEIEQEIMEMGGREIRIVFTPHLIPMNRGILTTIYLKQSGEIDELIDIYRDFYQDEFFVRVLEKGKLPNTKNVAGSNFCDIGIAVDKRTGYTFIISAIDNLIKGASGQAIQNMNIMMGYREKAGLDTFGIYP